MLHKQRQELEFYLILFLNKLVTGSEEDNTLTGCLN